MHELRAAGKSQAEAAAGLGLSLQLTGRFWRAAGAGQLLAVRGTSALDPYKPYLRARWDQGPATIAALQREITALGYRGGYTTTYAWLGQLKLAAPPRPPAPPTARQVACWILTDPAALGPAGTSALASLRARCPGLDALTGHVAGFATILTGRHGDQLDTWIAAVDADPGQPELSPILHDLFPGPGPGPGPGGGRGTANGSPGPRLLGRPYPQPQPQPPPRRRTLGLCTSPGCR